MRPEIQTIVEKNERFPSTKFVALIEIADKEFGDLAAYLTAGYDAGLSHGGLWQCEHCGIAVEDPCHPMSECGCVCLNDRSGTDTVFLCHECHEEAVSVLKKIVVHEETDEDGEVIGTSDDDSALTDDEKVLAGYIERGRDGAARQARDVIGMYPRNERRDLHRYQDQIDAANRNKGKTKEGE